MGEIYGKIGLCPAFCQKCVYHSREHNSCDYIIIEGHSRAMGQALPGEGCTVRVIGTRRAQPHVVHGQGSSPQTLPGAEQRKRAGHPRGPTEAHFQKLRLWEEGRSDLEIAQITGPTRKTVSEWRRINNLPANEPPAQEAPAPKPETLPKKKPGTKRKAPAKERAAKAEAFPDRLEMYHQGMTDAQIARAVGVKTGVIAQWRYKRNLPRIANGWLRLSADQEKARMELYRKGLNDCQIGRELGIDSNSIFMWRKSRGLPPCRTRHQLTEEEMARRQTLWEEGKTDSEIAEALGIHVSAVREWRYRAGLPCNRQKR